MTERMRRALRRHTILTGALAICGLVVMMVVLLNAVEGIRYLGFRVALDRASEVTTSGRTVETGWTFRFVQSQCAVSVVVDEAELAAAQSLDTRAVFGSKGWLREACVTDLIRAQARSGVIEGLAREFRRIRDVRGLSDDEYLELLTSAVQQIPYKRASAGLQLPAEILTSGVGICTDKSVLLASLLAHEGYDTAVLIFRAPSHVALGVASDGALFQETRYAFLETTAPRFIGQTAPEYRAAGPVARAPQIIPLGGWRSYNSGEEVDAILQELARAHAVQLACRRSARSFRATPSGPARRELQNWVAGARKTFILANTHDRSMVYATLRGSGVAYNEPRRIIAQ